MADRSKMTIPTVVTINNGDICEKKDDNCHVSVDRTGADDVMPRADELVVAAERQCLVTLVECELGASELDSTTSSSVATSGGATVSDDPWVLSDLQDTSPKWNELGVRGKLRRVFVQGIGKILVLVALLYFFICSLDFLSSAFRLLGGRAAGAAFSDSKLLSNPVAGLMIGVLATVLVQSSSTSSSIVVTMVASGIIQVKLAIPIIMGANIGTSVTNTIVSLAQSSNRNEFRRAFGGATVHDMFNWLTVFVLLPIEMFTNYLYHLTSAIVDCFNLNPDQLAKSGGSSDMLVTLTRPFTELIIQLDKKVIEGIAMNDPKYADRRLLKTWCGVNISEIERNVTELFNVTDGINGTVTLHTEMYLRYVNETINIDKCQFLFNWFGLDDVATGVILLIISLIVLCGCLILMVKVLNSALGGSMMSVVKKVINYDLPGYASYFSGYVAMMVGAGMTIVVQSSSVFTSTLTPLVGVGVITIERMYPLTLGSNIGTTTTGLLAAMAASNDQLRSAIQIALVHLCFNVTGILLFYPIPQMRIPIRLAKMMGNTTAKYRWFAVFYVVVMFFLAPICVFTLSMLHPYVMISVVSIFVGLLLVVSIVNILQRRRPSVLPRLFRNWNFLPLWMHSLAPLDRKIMTVLNFFRSACCCSSTCCQNCSSAPMKPLPQSDDEPNDGKAPLDDSEGSYSTDSYPTGGASICRLPSKLSPAVGRKNSSRRSSRLAARDSAQLSLISEHFNGNLGIYTQTKVPQSAECESGYASWTSTPHNTPAPTPCVSRLPSFAVIPEYHDEEEEIEMPELSSANGIVAVMYLGEKR